MRQDEHRVLMIDRRAAGARLYERLVRSIAQGESGRCHVVMRHGKAIAYTLEGSEASGIFALVVERELVAETRPELVGEQELCLAQVSDLLIAIALHRQHEIVLARGWVLTEEMGIVAIRQLEASDRELVGMHLLLAERIFDRSIVFPFVVFRTICSIAHEEELLVEPCRRNASTTQTYALERVVARGGIERTI